MKYCWVMFCAAVFGIAACSRLDARGAVPPPPPFSGGNAGDWLGSGPIFGFDDGGGPGGGWGGWWWGGGGAQGGWGWGSGGGSGGGWGGKGEVFDPTREFRGVHGTCWKETWTGGFYTCSCFYRYEPELPPCEGCPVHGFCRRSEIETGPGCENENDICKTLHAP